MPSLGKQRCVCSQSLKTLFFILLNSEVLCNSHIRDGIKHHLIKKEDEVLVSHFCKQTLSRTRLGKWQSNRQRAKKLRICVHPAPQSATGRMQLLGWATYFSPSARGGAPCVQNTARTNTWKELNMGMFERRKPVSKPLLLDSLCWCLGSLLNLLLTNSGFGLVPT